MNILHNTTSSISEKLNTPIVSVIIVNYKTDTLVVNLISSVFNNTQNITFEIIVVDNNSNDNCLKMISEEFNMRVKFIALKENIGFGKANNEGAKIAAGKYLLFLNSDTLLINNAIYILAHFLDTYQKVGICGGNLYNYNLKPTHSCMPVLPSIFLEIDSLLLHIPLTIIYGRKFDFNTTDKPLKVADIIGADLMIRSDLFERINGFDPAYFLYIEETDLAYRVKKKGYEIFSVPEAKIIHLEGKSMPNDIISRKYVLTSRKIFYKKTQSKPNRIFIDLIFSLKCFCAIAFSASTFNKKLFNYWIYTLKNGGIELW